MSKHSHTILIVDDDESMRDTLEALLKKNFNVLKASDGRGAIDAIKKNDIDVVLLDIRLPDINGIDVLKEIKENNEDIDVIIITAVREIDTAVKAVKMGAYDYITKDFDYDDIITRINRLIESQRKKRELLYFKSEMERYLDVGFIVGNSKKMREVYNLVQKVAKVPTTILIRGETGTGKELLARVIRQESGLKDAPFVTVNLTAIPSELVESELFGHERGAFTGAVKQRFGKFELANGGFIFLDEIGDLKYDLQSKLLRVIQEGEIQRVGGAKGIDVNVRIISATHVDLEKKMKEGQFREDLFYRLNVVPVKLPPLRERLEDIPMLTDFFIAKYNRRFNKNVNKVSDGAIDVLMNYNWPGNIRELENLIERLVIMAEGEELTKKEIPVEFQIPSLDKEQKSLSSRLDFATDTFERNYILKTIERVRGSRKAAAEALGIPISTLKYKLSRLNLYNTVELEAVSKARESNG
ncbi:MAG: sigma-54-dependent Fis family transcriptional regulator [Nitrospinae bacterium]|nr:sigma-54-dependent Fis family transcriptional regulator [Nitrospinota bacterium]